MQRRTFLQSLSATAITAAAGALPALAALPKMKITRVRAYTPPRPNPLFNQSDVVVTRERINPLREQCTEVRVGGDGDWVIDFHQRFDLADASRGCNEPVTSRAQNYYRPDGSLANR